MNFAEFTHYLYERPVNGTEWYFSDEHVDPNLQKDRLVQLAAQAFNDVAKAANQFAEAGVHGIALFSQSKLWSHSLFVSRYIH